MSDGFELKPDGACCARLNWRLLLPAEVAEEQLAAAFEGSGFVARCQRPEIWVFRRVRDRAELAYVPRTRRLQLRIDITVPEAERPGAAMSLASELAANLS
ncbi:MAG TPA: hypothetical protein PK413_17925 [Thermoanaerobaculia bacterium]|nr:hypothetical protein [Thermoanaerobaculia bacterium]